MKTAFKWLNDGVRDCSMLRHRPNRVDISGPAKVIADVDDMLTTLSSFSYFPDN
jgi:hypothetical protein